MNVTQMLYTHGEFNKALDEIDRDLEFHEVLALLYPTKANKDTPEMVARLSELWNTSTALHYQGITYVEAVKFIEDYEEKEKVYIALMAEAGETAAKTLFPIEDNVRNEVDGDAEEEAAWSRLYHRVEHKLKLTFPKYKVDHDDPWYEFHRKYEGFQSACIPNLGEIKQWFDTYTSKRDRNKKARVEHK